MTGAMTRARRRSLSLGGLFRAPRCGQAEHQHHRHAQGGARTSAPDEGKQRIHFPGREIQRDEQQDDDKTGTSIGAVRREPAYQAEEDDQRQRNDDRAELDEGDERVDGRPARDDAEGELVRLEHVDGAGIRQQRRVGEGNRTAIREPGDRRQVEHFFAGEWGLDHPRRHRRRDDDHEEQNVTVAARRSRALVTAVPDRGNTERGKQQCGQEDRCIGGPSEQRHQDRQHKDPAIAEGKGEGDVLRPFGFRRRSAISSSSPGASSSAALDDKQPRCEERGLERCHVGGSSLPLTIRMLISREMPAMRALKSSARIQGACRSLSVVVLLACRDHAAGVDAVAIRTARARAMVGRNLETASAPHSSGGSRLFNGERRDRRKPGNTTWPIRHPCWLAPWSNILTVADTHYIDRATRRIAADAPAGTMRVPERRLAVSSTRPCSTGCSCSWRPPASSPACGWRRTRTRAIRAYPSAGPTVVVLQPGYLPWLGFFDQLRRADVFVYYDDVQYDKHGWRNRNRIKTQDGPQWLTVPVRHGGDGFPAHPRRRDRRPHAVGAQARWPACGRRTRGRRFSIDYLPELEELLQRAGSGWSISTSPCAALMARWLGLRPRIERSSALEIGGERSARLVSICRAFRRLDATCRGDSAAALSRRRAVRGSTASTSSGSDTPIRPTRSCTATFVPYLSAIDLLLQLRRARLR